MKQLFPYAGSSKKVAPLIAEMIRREGCATYCEPMVGSGAVFFELQPENAIINDLNELNSNLYKVIRDDVDGLIKVLRTLPATRDLFERYQETIHSIYNNVECAAAWYFLLVLCYNGVVKFKDSKPNLTWGDRYLTWHEKLDYRTSLLRAASYLLRNTRIDCEDYALVHGDITFYDPPWFDSGEDYGVDFDHRRLAQHLHALRSKWILTVNEHPDAYIIYRPISNWERALTPYYSVAPISHGRGERKELLLTNFAPKLFGG